jgi:hypothetical protein
MLVSKANTQYEVPYVGGYSKDGQTIYLDKRFARDAVYHSKITNDRINMVPFITYHESIEAAEMQRNRGNFNPAHRIAEQKMDDLLRKQGIDIEEFCEHLYDWVQFCLLNFDNGAVPPDLDLRPYEQDRLAEVLAKLEPGRKVLYPQHVNHLFLVREMLKDIQS